MSEPDYAVGVNPWSHPILSEAWEWLDDFWKRHQDITTFDEDKQLEQERKQWYKKVMPLLRTVDPTDRGYVAEVLNIIHECSMYTGYPDHWAPEELAKWKQKYDK